MSPHGTPDWGLVGPKSIVYGLDDMGELAVRLGSSHLWDRRGDVLYATDFRDGMGMFYAWGIGLGWAVNLVTSHSRQGAYSVNLKAGSNLEAIAAITLRLPFQEQSSVGLECSFSIDALTSSILDQHHWYDGSRHCNAFIRYDHVGKQLLYLDNAGAEIVLANNIDLRESIYPEHTMKLVVNMIERTYVRFMLDDLTYNMKGTGIWSEASIVRPYWLFAITHYAVPGNNPDCYVDNVIVTQNEP